MTRRVSAVAALVAILALDAIARAREWPLVVVGLLDEPAHLLTAWLLLAAVLPGRYRRLRRWALLGAVLIDVDHVPLFLWDVGAATAFGRPVTHSLALALVLLTLSWPRTRVQTPLRGLAVGVALHLVRDVATGPGLSLLWPVTSEGVLVAYSLYAALLCLATAAAVLRPEHPGLHGLPGRSTGP
jgi:inner membrane protein